MTTLPTLTRELPYNHTLVTLLKNPCVQIPRAKDFLHYLITLSLFISRLLDRAVLSYILMKCTTGTF